MTPTKPVWQSRTVWTNAIIILLAVLGVLIANGDAPLTWGIIATALTAGLNVALRLTTNTGLSVGTPLGEQPAYRRANDASGDPDAMRAVPAPDLAPDPAAGAPSLADKLAADMGLEPEDKP